MSLNKRGYSLFLVEILCTETFKVIQNTSVQFVFFLITLRVMFTTSTVSVMMIINFENSSTHLMFVDLLFDLQGIIADGLIRIDRLLSLDQPAQ